MSFRFYPVSLATFLVCSLAGATAQAAEVSVSGGDAVVNKTDCRALATYRPTPGVKGADYQPGVDAKGNYVAPADLPGGSTYQLPARVEFNVTINPIGYAQRAAAQKQIASSSTALGQNQANLTAAQAKQTQLAQQLTALQTTQTTLSTQQAAFTTQIANQTAIITAATGGASPTQTQLNTRTIQIAGATTVITGSAAYQSLQSQITANNQAIASTNAAITANNAVIAAAPANATAAQTQLNAAQGQLAGVSGQYDNTAMSVGHVVVDTKTGAVTIDGKPITNESEAYLADLCRKAGF